MVEDEDAIAEDVVEGEEEEEKLAVVEDIGNLRPWYHVRWNAAHLFRVASAMLYMPQDYMR